MDSSCKSGVSTYSPQALQIGSTQKEIKAVVRYTYATLWSLRLIQELTTLWECRNIIGSQDIRAVIFLDIDFWFVPTINSLNWPPFRSGTATPLSLQSVVMYSPTGMSLFAYKCTANNVQSTSWSFSAQIKTSSASSLPRNLNFFSCCFPLATLPAINPPSSEPGRLRKL